MWIRHILEVDAHRPPAGRGRGRRLLGQSRSRSHKSGGEQQKDDGRATHVFTFRQRLCRRRRRIISTLQGPSGSVALWRAWHPKQTSLSSMSTPSGRSRSLRRSNDEALLTRLRPEASRIQQCRAAAREAVLQPGEPERLRSREHAGGSAGAGLHENARATRCARAERRRRLRARVEQERTSHAAAHARHRHTVVDHVQRRRRTSRVRRPDPLAGDPQA